MIVNRNKINHQGDVGAPTAYLKNDKLLFSSVLSRKNDAFMTLDISSFCVMTPMNDYGYLRINLSTIPQEIIKGCNLNEI